MFVTHMCWKTFLSIKGHKLTNFFFLRAMRRFDIFRFAKNPDELIAKLFSPSWVAECSFPAALNLKRLLLETTSGDPQTNINFNRLRITIHSSRVLKCTSYDHKSFELREKIQHLGDIHNNLIRIKMNL